MKLHELILFFLTFVFGLFCGMMLYVMVYAPAYKNSNVTDISKLSFQLNGQMYGACQRGTMVCPSFTLNDDRTYEYIPWYSSTNDKPSTVHGTLSATTFAQIKTALLSADYTTLNHPGGICRADKDGTDYQYDVIINGVQYHLDTCNTRFGVSALATTLAPLWSRLSVATATDQPTVFSGQTVFSFMEHMIATWFPAGHESAPVTTH